MSALFAFLHHAAAFVLFAALAVELVTLRDELTLKSTRRLQLADAIFGASAGVLLVVGLARVFYFEKGAAYYWSNLAFLAKFSLFVLIGLLSIYPTVRFLSWRSALKQGRPPQVDAGTLRALKAIVHVELMVVVLLMLLGALMARGIG